MAAGVITGFCNDEVNPPGPVHDHDVALLEFAFNVTVPPMQTGPLLVAPVDEGIGLTTTVVVYADDEPQPLPGLLTVSE